MREPAWHHHILLKLLDFTIKRANRKLGNQMCSPRPGFKHVCTHEIVMIPRHLNKPCKGPVCQRPWCCRLQCAQTAQFAVGGERIRCVCMRRRVKHSFDLFQLELVSTKWCYSFLSRLVVEGRGWGVCPPCSFCCLHLCKGHLQEA